MPTSAHIIENIVKSAVCSIGDIDARVQSQFQALTNTTLNFKYTAFHEIVPTQLPRIQYFGLGIKGFVNADDGILATPYTPSNKELDLYEPIPIRCVPADEDLSAAERANYRLRVRKTVNNIPYFFYYLKKLTTIDNTVKITQTNPITNQQEPYTFSAADLTPVPAIPATSGEQSGEVATANISFRVGMEYLGSEVLEAINVLYGGDMRYAKISEIGLYSGQDQQVTGYDVNNVPFQYTESVFTQLCYKICNIGTAVPNSSFRSSRSFLLGDGNLITL